MKKLTPLFLLVFLMSYQSATAQQSGNTKETYEETSLKNSEEEGVYAYEDLDNKPDMIEGKEAFYRKWNAAAKYPMKARRNGIEGKVFLSVIINEKGEMTEPKVEHSLGYGCDEAAIEALLETKCLWTPGIKNGQPVKVRIFLPFVFKLK